VEERNNCIKFNARCYVPGLGVTVNVDVAVPSTNPALVTSTVTLNRPGSAFPLISPTMYHLSHAVSDAREYVNKTGDIQDFVLHICTTNFPSCLISDYNRYDFVISSYNWVFSNLDVD